MSENNGDWSTSPTLVQRVKARDAEAWSRLCDVYSPLVFAWVRRAGISIDDAPDVVQEVFRAVLAGIDGFRRERAEDTFRGWLLVVTRNEIRGWYRRRQKQVATGEGGTDAALQLVQLATWVDSDDEAAELANDPGAESELIRRAADLVRQDFQTQTWQAFWRATVEGHAAADVAQDLQMSAGAVRQAKFRVLARLREVLE
ncbi:MAG: RNA polymerase sigma factor [Planctomycetales bacterium]|nr:RNA polymerase sigma factor [Planctomycetales bacterium]